MFLTLQRILSQATAISNQNSGEFEIKYEFEFVCQLLFFFSLSFSVLKGLVSL